MVGYYVCLLAVQVVVKHGDLRFPRVSIPACSSAVAAVALCLDGSTLALASDKGTFVRMFDTHTGLSVRLSACLPVCLSACHMILFLYEMKAYARY